MVVIADIPLYFTMLLSRGVQTLFTGNSPLYPLTQLNEEKTFLVWNRTEVPKLFEKMFLSDKLQKQKLIPSSTGLISKKYRFKGSNRVKFDIFDELLRFADDELAGVFTNGTVEYEYGNQNRPFDLSDIFEVREVIYENGKRNQEFAKNVPVREAIQFERPSNFWLKMCEERMVSFVNLGNFPWSVFDGFWNCSSANLSSQTLHSLQLSLFRSLFVGELHTKANKNIQDKANLLITNYEHSRHHPLLAIDFSSFFQLNRINSSHSLKNHREQQPKAFKWSVLELEKLNICGRMIKSVENATGVEFRSFVIVTSGQHVQAIEKHLIPWFSLKQNVSSIQFQKRLNNKAPILPYDFIALSLATSKHAAFLIGSGLSRTAQFIALRIGARIGFSADAFAFWEEDFKEIERKIPTQLSNNLIQREKPLLFIINETKRQFLYNFNEEKQAFSASLLSKISAFPREAGYNVIAFSVYGNITKYIKGAIKNSVLCGVYYVGWVCRFYVDEFFPTYAKHFIQKVGGEVLPFPRMEGLTQPIGHMFARFLVAADPAVNRFLIRDTDSRLGARERIAVQQWVESPADFHVLRDHWSHCYSICPILGGLWGGRGTLISDISLWIKSWTIQHGRDVEKYNNDQLFLEKYVWPRVKDSLYAHDSYCCEKWRQNTHVFTTERIAFEHCGQVFDEHDCPVQLHMDQLKNRLSPAKCATNITTHDQQLKVL